MSHYRHFTVSELERIWAVIKVKTVRQISQERGCSTSTSSLELKCNDHAQSYRPSDEQKAYKKYPKRCRRHIILAE